MGIETGFLLPFSVPLSCLPLGPCDSEGGVWVWAYTQWNAAFPGHTRLPIPVHLRTRECATPTAAQELIGRGVSRDLCKQRNQVAMILMDVKVEE
jgi:hypothetical protein